MRKLSSESTQKHQRSRDGCLECRKRRISCDKTRPCCDKCKQRGVKCEYFLRLKFKEDLEAKGAVFGREGVWRKGKKKNSGDGCAGGNSNDLSVMVKREFFIDPTRSRSGNLYFVNVSVEDMGLGLPRLSSSSVLSSSIVPQGVYHGGGILSPGCDSHLSDSINYALTYYLEYVAPIFSPTKFRQLHMNQDLVLSNGLDFQSLVQYSNTNEHIFYLLLSVGSSYLTKQDPTHTDLNFWNNQAKNFKLMAINIIKQKLNTLTHRSQDRNSELVCDLLLSTLLLCLFDLSNDTNDNWSKHLDMARWLIKKFEPKPTNGFQEKSLGFVMDFFGYQEAMGRTACRKSSKFNTENWETVPKEMETSKTLITWMGCDKKLVGIISDITDLSYERVRDNSSIRSSENYLELVQLIDDGLRMVKDSNIEDSFQLMKKSKQDCKMYENDIDKEEFCFLLGCETKRLAASLYHRCALLNKSPKDAIVIDLVKKLCDYLKFIILDNGYSWAFLLWPIFIMSVEINPLSMNCESFRTLVLDMLDHLEVNSLGNVNKTREVILSIWKKRDLSVDEREIKLNKSSTDRVLGDMNDWEMFVADERYNISLA